MNNKYTWRDLLHELLSDKIDLDKPISINYYNDTDNMIIRDITVAKESVLDNHNTNLTIHIISPTFLLKNNLRLCSCGNIMEYNNGQWFCLCQGENQYV